ncbi:MAG: EAL domain-containing protein, partial [Elainella sp.]
MDHGLEQFLAETPGVIWELEAQGSDWVFTKRYGEYLPLQRQDLIGQSLFELYPPGHPTLQTISTGIRSGKTFTCIDSTTPGRFYQTRCKPVSDESGQIHRLVGISIDITEMIAAHLKVIQESSKLVGLLESQILTTVQNIISEPHFFQHFYLVYQPIVALAEPPDSPAVIKGVEALIRLQVENRTIPPSQFLPSLEMTGQISDLALWVLEQARQDLEPLLEQNPDFFVSVNIGVEDLLHADRRARIEEMLRASPRFAQSLHLEILESHAPLAHYEDLEIAQICYELRGLGVKLALDDFGIQASNFDRLSLLANDDFLKLDRRFTPRELHGTHASICLSMVWVGKALQLKLIAEGVET